MRCPLPRLGILCASVVVVGCGGTTFGSVHGDGGSGGGGGFDGGTGGSGGQGTGGAGGGSGGAEAGAFLPIPGSYDLLVGKVTATGGYGGSPEAASPSEGQTMRLDVQSGSAGALEGIVAPRWGMPGAVSGPEAQGTYALSGSVAVSSSGSGMRVTDQWTTLTVAASGDGLGSTVSMVGTENVLSGDVMWTYDLTAAATLSVDATSPELRSAPASPRGPKDELLPWDPIRVDIAEPVEPSAFESKVSILLSDVDAAGHETKLPVTWRYLPVNEPSAASGVVRAEASLSGWDHRPTQTALPYRVAAAAGIPDPTGLESAELSVPFAVLDVGQPRASFPFDDPQAAAPASWGHVAPGGASTSSASRCDQTGCLEIGPYNTQYCDTSRHGIAGRAQAPTGTLAVRYRVFFAPADPGGGEPPHPFGPAFTVEIAHAGAPAIAQQISTPSEVPLTDLGAAFGELHWATEWSTATVALENPPPMVIDLGFAISSADATAMWCGGGPLPQPVKTLVVLDSVAGQ